MITKESFSAGIRCRNWDDAIALANALIGAAPARSCDPYQAWQAHPVVSQFLHLSDRDIAQAIDVANANQ